MIFQKTTYRPWIYSFLRIYRIFGVFCVLILLDLKFVYGQIPLSIGDYKTISSGNYHNPGIWEVWNGTSWISATSKPSSGNSIFIDQGHEVSLTQDEQANHVYLFSAASPGRKLNLQNYELQIYGSLKGMQKTGGVFVINTVSNATIDWIYPESGKIVFKGNSRTVVDRSSWSANTLNSRYTVVFDPNPNDTLIVNAGFKANRFIIKSGTVYQTVNTIGIPACSTFSFNNQMIFNGTGPFGELIIESGATLISECTSPLSSIIRRSESVPAALLKVEPNGTLILLGNQPTIDVAQSEFLGNISYSAMSGSQQFLTRTMSGAIIPKSYHSLIFENYAQKTLIDSLQLSGNFEVRSGPFPLHSNGFVSFIGNEHQHVIGNDINFFDLKVDKDGGNVQLSDHLNIQRNFYSKNGQIDFQENDLILNESGSGGLVSSNGSWWRLDKLIYKNIPLQLTSSNATFPLGDRFQGGIRRVRITGDSPGGNLLLKYIELPGANWDPNFDDLDGTPILYQLNSYIELSELSSSSSTIELKISAENLIVDNVDDLRIVSNGSAAPGVNLYAIDSDSLWARREIPYSLLNNQSFTIGSYRVLSILPLRWKSFGATWKNGIVKIHWETFDEKNTSHFVIRKSVGGVDNFLEIGRTLAEGKETNEYQLEYALRSPDRHTFFQIEQVDMDGQNSFSDVFRLKGLANLALESDVSVYPNPYSLGNLQIDLPKEWKSDDTQISILNSMGQPYFSGNLSEFYRERKMETAPKGVYIFYLKEGQNQKIIRLVKN